MKDKITNDLIEDFKLPKYIKGMTFAEASKAIDDKFKDRKDTYANQTKEELLERLAEAQEYVKMQLEAEEIANMPPEMQEQMAQEQMMQQQGQMGSQGIPDLGQTLQSDSNMGGQEMDPQMMEQMMQQQGGQQMAAGGFLSGGNPKIKPQSTDPTARLELQRGVNDATGITFDEVTANNLFGLPDNGSNPNANRELNLGRYKDRGFFDIHDQGTNYRLSPTHSNPQNARGYKEQTDYLQKLNPKAKFDRYAYKRHPDRSGRKMEMGGNADVDLVNGLTASGLESMTPQASADTSGLSAVEGIGGAVGGAVGGKMGGAIGGATSLIGQGIGAFGDTGIDTSGKSGRQAKVNVGGAVAKGAASGAAAGAFLGPWGAAGGAIVGGGIGFFGATSKNKANQKANTNADMIEMDQYDNDFANGGYMGLKNKGIKGRQMPDGGFADKKNNPMLYGSEPITEPNRSLFGSGLDWLGKNYGEITSYAPVAGELFNKIDRPITESSPRLDNRYKRSLYDEQAMENTINQNNIAGALSEASGGDTGMLSSNLTASHANKLQALSQANQQGRLDNAAENRAEQQFNLGIDSTNLAQEERNIERRAQDQGVYNTARDTQRRAILEDIGKIGREQSNKNIIERMYGYKYNGRYYVDKNGERVSDERIAQVVSSINNNKQDN